MWKAKLRRELETCGNQAHGKERAGWHRKQSRDAQKKPLLWKRIWKFVKDAPLFYKFDT